MMRSCLSKIPPLRAGYNGGSYDLATLLISYRSLEEFQAPEKFITFWQTFEHERCHYLHHIGTTTGAFLALLRFHRMVVVSEQLKNLPSSVLSRISTDRKRGGRAIVAIDQKNDEKSPFRLLPPVPGEHEDANFFRQIIFENWWAWDAVYDWPRAIRIGYYREPQIFAYILREAINLSHALFATPKAKFSTNDMQFSRSLTRMWNGEPLGTINLMEGAAVANELLYLLFIEAPIDQIKARFVSIMPTSYGKALCLHFQQLTQLQCRLWKSPPKRLVLVLISFLILCDVALNPPLPPIVTAPLSDYHWEELFPPLRFDLALKALPIFDEFRLEDDEFLLSHEFATMMISRICQICGFLDVTKFTFPTSGIPPRFAPHDLFYNELSKVNTYNFDDDRISDIILSGMSSYDYLLCLHRMAWAERQQNLPAIVLPGYDFSRFVDPRGIYLLDGTFSPGLFAPPVAVDNVTQDLAVMAGAEPDHAMAFETKVFTDYLLDQILFDTGEPDLPVCWKREYQQASDIFEDITDAYADIFSGQYPWSPNPDL